MRPTAPQQEINLPAGMIRYRDSGGGSPVVFVHGYLVDGRLWEGVAGRLSDRHRCLVPDWPLAAHRVAMRPDADLSPPGIAAIIAGFLEELDLHEVTIVGNDSGGAMSQVLVTRHPERIARLVLTNCDCYENFPPGIFKALPPLAALPGAVTLMAQPFRVGALGRRAFRPFTRKRLADELIASWLEPSIHDRDVRHDMKKVTVGMNKRHTLEAARRLRDSDLPILLAWAPGDRFFPLEYAQRLAGDARNARLVEIEGAGTFVALDQPQRLAEEIAAFIDTS
ncbi:MAG: alpha/beta fold hydrolase [Solirubrobacterales bacterium]